MSTVCPVCERLVLQPSPASIHSVSWGECACTDDGPCVAHQCDPSDMPKRPGPQVLMRRAEAESERRVRRYERMCARIEAAAPRPGYRTVQVSEEALEAFRDLLRTMGDPFYDISALLKRATTLLARDLAAALGEAP